MTATLMTTFIRTLIAVLFVAFALPLQAATTEMPTLSIRWGCGDCAYNEKVIPLIQQVYAEQVRKHQQKISKKDIAEVVITDFRQRPPTARVMLGGFAGKDRLGLSIRYRGKSYKASDSAITIMNGMNSLCKAVAQSTYAQLAGAK